MGRYVFCVFFDCVLVGLVLICFWWSGVFDVCSSVFNFGFVLLTGFFYFNGFFYKRLVLWWLLG